MSYKKTFQYGNHTVILETGGIARQANGAVLVNVADTVVLVTVVARKDADPGRDFFPMTVNYQERTYAAGKIPGGFFKREGRPNEKETLTSRLIDRPLRPLFPEGFKHETQIVATVMSINPEVDPDIPALIGASAAVAVSGVPFAGPIGAARVGYRDGEYLLNPTASELAESDLDLVVAGTENAVIMVESEASELSEEVMLGAVMFGHEQMQAAIQAIKELAADVGKPAWDWTPPADDSHLEDRVAGVSRDLLIDAYQIPEKQARTDRLNSLRASVVEQLATGAEGAPSADAVKTAFHDLEYRIVRDRILDGNPRIDGRDNRTVRPITVRTGVLPRAHGSALFTRGETQALVVATLGTDRDAQVIDAIEGERRDRFMLHYNFPPYCTGETGMVGSPKRREIGHGRLAKRGVQAVMPKEDSFPYVVRVVSEITESNGSSSMASVCGTSLALMDAGVPLKAPVAGIAMGLIKEGDRFAVGLQNAKTRAEAGLPIAESVLEADGALTKPLTAKDPTIVVTEFLTAEAVWKSLHDTLADLESFVAAKRHEEYALSRQLVELAENHPVPEDGTHQAPLAQALRDMDALISDKSVVSRWPDYRSAYEHARNAYRDAYTAAYEHVRADVEQTLAAIHAGEAYAKAPSSQRDEVVAAVFGPGKPCHYPALSVPTTKTLLDACARRSLSSLRQAALALPGYLGQVESALRDLVVPPPPPETSWEWRPGHAFAGKRFATAEEVDEMLGSVAEELKAQIKKGLIVVVR